MQILIFLFIISQTNLVRSNDNVAMESNVSYQGSYKVHDDPQDSEAQPSGHYPVGSFPIVVQTFGKKGSHTLKQTHGGSQNELRTSPQKFAYSEEDHLGEVQGISHPQHLPPQSQQHFHQQTKLVMPPEGFRLEALAHNEVDGNVQVGHHPEHANPQQQTYVQQHPNYQVRVVGVQSSHPSQPSHQQVGENDHGGKATGFTSFVEHFSSKDDAEEIKSAVKEGSVDDIKRLVPKSEVTFKIYHKGKPSVSVPEQQKTIVRPDLHNYPPKKKQQKPEEPVKLLHKLKVEVPVSPFRIQAINHEFSHPTPSPKPMYLKPQVEFVQKTVEHPQVVQVVDKFPHLRQPQDVNLQTVYYSKVEEQPQGPTLNVPHFQVKLKEENYDQEVSGVDHDSWGSVTNKPETPKPVEFHDSKSWYSAGGITNTEAIKPEDTSNIADKPPETFLFQVDPYIDIDTNPSPKNNFDHQKAIEGSLSFDIKNAIGSTTPETSTKMHPITVPDFQTSEKPSFAYVIPKTTVLPTSTVSIGNSVHDSSTAENFPAAIVQDAVTSTSEFSHSISPAVVPQMNLKFFEQPQAIVWESDHLKHSNALTDFHRPLIHLHLPKEGGLHQYLKHPNHQVDFQKMHQMGFHREIPYANFVQDIHVLPKSPSFFPQGANIRQNHLKHPDWSLHHPQPNFPTPNLNTILMKPDLLPLVQGSTKKIIPILMKKRKNRSHKPGGIVYGKTMSQGPAKPDRRQEKTPRVQFRSQPKDTFNQLQPKTERQNEFSVSASYKVDRTLKNSDSS